MTIHRMFALVALPFLVGACSLIPNKAMADPSNQLAQQPGVQQPGSPDGQPNRDRPGQPGQRRRPHRRIDFAAAAQKLGVTEAQLKTALGVPANPPSPSTNPPNATERRQRRPRLDIEGAATKLGVTQQQLRDALGIPQRPPGDRPGPNARPAQT
ncbi:hypothetical protein [Leptolyngbya sp. FACHB-261]|uniref:hypothetical protein n=1 Tax=Leptolyngbya sp. FACHB-261 TaxID=2692806 RepID=UPI001686805D|nr:hypothetical protein [Leptolyngbya sp. FACHB-261]MBD2101651.1 hypothetical protein [Leptolyngbya sp. FACHB-261]